jgi:aspartyl-tRNA(Asn)/glutamyl-tRNA(Gln) amidotransferase subunit A
MRKNWGNLTASDLGAAIGRGKINPVELTEYFLDKIAGHPNGAQIYARTTPGRARGEALAAAARAKAGLRRGPLDGVPLSWKDNFDSAGTATEAGSALLRGRTPAQDAEALRNAALGGLVCLGKTHMSELAFSGLGLNPMTATPPCVNDPNAVAGGSSSGAATSVGFGLAPAAIGSDTGGSVRLPAAWNDLVGFKTAHGSLPMGGVLPLCARFDAIGPLARTVADCAQIWAALAGAPAPDLAQATISGARLAVLEDAALDDLRTAPAKGFDDALTRLTRAGAQITRLRFVGVNRALALSGLIFSPEAYAIWRTTIESAPEKMFPPILERFRQGAGVLAADYIAAWAELETIRTQWRAQVAGFDAVLMPTSAILPPTTERLLTDSAYFVAENLLALRNTRIGNLMGGAAITLPTSQPSVGISLLAADGAFLLRLASGVERALQ